MSAGKPGTLRVVAGSRRGRRLRVPVEGGVRPTGEKVREAIFDVLGPVDGLHVLDLFAGSGAMGLEALSRGAEHCVFVEGDRHVAGVLRDNVATLQFASTSFQIVVSDYLRAAEHLAAQSVRFDLLFVDPPYRMLQEVEVMLEPFLPILVADDGLVVVEAHRSVPVAMSLTPVFDRVYGDTRVVMLEKRRSR